MVLEHFAVVHGYAGQENRQRHEDLQEGHLIAAVTRAGQNGLAPSRSAARRGWRAADAPGSMAAMVADRDRDPRADARRRAALTAAALVAYGNWLGSSEAGPGGGGADAPSAYQGVKSWLRGQSEGRPLDVALSTVLVGGVLFYLAERGKNDRINNVYDALLYVATSLNVGYAESHPKTDTGKALASLVHTLGPNIASRALERPVGTDEQLVLQQKILERLDAIHQALLTR